MGDLQRQPAGVLRRRTGRERGREGRDRRLGAESGLTLIELLVVMVILGLFSTIVYQAFFPQVDKAKIQTVRTQMDIIGLSLDSYKLDVGDYPPTLEELVTSSSPRWKGPYLQKGKVPKDPWGNDYTYQLENGGADFKLCSTGDGKQEICYGQE